MSKLILFVSLFALLGLLLGTTIGFVDHEYELNKCKSLSVDTNQDYYDYDLKTNCYFVLTYPKWNLLVSCLVVGVVVAVVFGLISLFIGYEVLDL